MRDLTTFILGVGFTLVIMPAMQCLGDIVMTVAEDIKARIAISITKSNKKISETSGEGGYAIGFQYEPTEECYEEDEDEEEESV